ncbi:MAG: AI-2E family transporter [Deltaproteobacteria bacterium]|nr:AI-2E family transporter [Deltaproteobacteria bacterium]MBW2015324.1 AI-2E family transporter [Deltaproteobacteria bacterium]MBW2128185.1 AI-2E family transporter [Deltaproteobacteria bacterium]MBW2303098.1 AI-2E family transporter [Deltaproteobacteria bacterium]
MEKGFISKLFFIVLIGMLILLFRLFWTYLSAIVLALLIASAFYPIYWRLRRLLKYREQTASLLMTLFILIILVVPVGGFVGTLSNEAFDFYVRTRNSVSLKKIQDGLLGDSQWARRIRKVGELSGIQFTPETIQGFAASLGKNVGLFLSRQLSYIASNLMSFLIHFFLMILVIYYIFKDGNRLKTYISELVPFPAEQQELVVKKFREMGRAIIFGNGLSGIIQGVLGGFGFFLFSLGSPFLWGTLIGIMAFLPVIGASIIFIPAALILLAQGKAGTALAYLIYNVFYSSIMEYLIKPRLIGKGMQMNPLLVFIGILGGLKLFGILGIIYGPLIMTIFLTLAEIYKLEYKKDLC